MIISTTISITQNWLSIRLFLYPSTCLATTTQETSQTAQRKKFRKLRARVAKPAIAAALPLWTLTSRYVKYLIYVRLKLNFLFIYLMHMLILCL